MYVVVDFMPHAVYRQIADTAADLCLTLLCVISAGTLSNYCSHVHTLPIGSFSDGSSNRKISHLHTVTQCRTKKNNRKKTVNKKYSCLKTNKSQYINFKKKFNRK